MSLENRARELRSRGNRDLRKKYIALEAHQRARFESSPQQTFDAIRKATSELPPAHPNLITDTNKLPRTPLK